MRRLFKLVAAFCFSFVALVLATVLGSYLSILMGFGGTAVLPADCGLVFGAAISGRNTAGPAIMRRVGGAAALWNDGQVNTLILSGGKGDSWRFSEAAVMRQEAIRAGVDGRSIFVEDSARSTKENLANSKKIVEEHCDSVVAISDQYHLARIRLLAKKAGWGSLQTYGVPDRPVREDLQVIRELAAYLYYALGADAFLRLDTYDDVVDAPVAGSGTQIP